MGKRHPFAQRMRELIKVRPTAYETFRRGIENPDPAISANVIIGLIRVTIYLLERQLITLENEFLKTGGLREQMHRARRASRGY